MIKLKRKENYLLQIYKYILPTIQKIIRFHLDAETGCSIGEFTVSLKKRWNYESDCAAAICSVALRK